MGQGFHTAAGHCKTLGATVTKGGGAYDRSIVFYWANQIFHYVTDSVRTPQVISAKFLSSGQTLSEVVMNMPLGTTNTRVPHLPHLKHTERAPAVESLLCVSPHHPYQSQLQHDLKPHRAASSVPDLSQTLSLRECRECSSGLVLLMRDHTFQGIFKGSPRLM